MWNDPSHRLALLELWARGTLRRRHAQAGAWDELVRLGWMRLTSRRDEGVLDEAARGRVEAALDAGWTEWRDVAERLRSEQLTPDERGLKELQRRERAGAVPDEVLRARMNLRTATALVGAHSKATLTAADLGTLGEPEILRDGLVRLRTPAGMRLVRDGVEVDCALLSGVLGEVVLTERALRDGTRLCGAPRDGTRTGGMPRAVLSVENRGPYLDLSVPEGWLVAHAPGWDVATLVLLMAEHLTDVPWLHFGDLDPQGVAIVRHLRSARADVGWLVPPWWSDLVGSRGLVREWPEGLVTAADPPLVRTLAERGLWLEQESVALDSRLGEAMEGWLAEVGSRR